MRTLVIGDIHGNYKGFIQCLEQSNFDYENDRLICLGDVCDGFPFVRDCFNELLKIKNLVYILGNHDWWARQYYLGRLFDPTDQQLWTGQGGANTLKSYGYQMMDKEHLDLLVNAKLYYIENNNLFVHGGINHQKKIENHDEQDLMWDRSLVQLARQKSLKGRDDLKFAGYDNIFVGHTTTQAFKCKGEPIIEPLHMCNVWMLDTGGGWDAKITIMDIQTYEYWQSDMATDLYPEIRGRR